MKKLIFSLFLALALISSSAYADNVIKVDREFGSSFAGYAPDRCVVVFKEGASPNSCQKDLDQIALNYQVNRFAQEFPTATAAAKTHSTDEVLTRYYKAHFPEGNLDEVMAAYRALPTVEKVEPIELFYVTATPNDFFYDEGSVSFPFFQWHYWDTYGISTDQAWDLETGDPSVVCAVIDGGVRYYHFELGGSNPPGPNDNSTNGNIWVNSGEIPGNSIDDDNNGYVDDVIGWDFVATASQCNDVVCAAVDNDPADCAGHGTHVAGTIAAITNNYATWGVAGIAGGWNDGTTEFTSNGVKIMCLRAGWASPLGGLMSMDYCAQALYYVATMKDKGVNIAAVNCSWGSSSYLAAAVDAVLARDVMIIVAAGNDNSSSQDYLGLREDCMDVGATDVNGNPASFSQYGTWIEVAAPGVDILSTFHNSDDPEGDYIALMSGTSMSCPHVVGVAGLLESYNPDLTGLEKFAIIADPANMKSYTMSKYVGAGIVDAKKCLDAAGGGGGCTVAPTANFSGTPTVGYAPLAVSFSDLSSDDPTSWLWNFGDGVGTSTLKNPSYTYPNAGTYTVTLTATNDCGSDQEVKTGYITVNPFVGSSLHVAAISVYYVLGGRNYYARADVTVHDQNNNPVAGAVVYGYFNAPNTNTKTGTTNSSGVATLSADKTKTKPAEFCFTVTNIVLTGYTYASGSNVVTQACESGPVYGEIGDMAAMPKGFSLDNRPNPFNPTTTIALSLPEASNVQIDIYNIVGQKVATLIDGYLEAGQYSFEWDGSNVASGIYLYRLTTDEFSKTKQMVLMK